MIVSKSDILSIRKKIDWDFYIEKVKPIVEEVKRRGDEALIEFTMKFDGVRQKYLRVPKEEIDQAYDLVDDEIIDALEIARENIERFHSITAVDRDIKIDFGDCILGKRYTPIESVGVYIPGGRASYPSTALMAGIPAKIAGVERLVACTPPDESGGVKPLTLVACDLAGFDEIYVVGGAQAIAGMAYGTETIEPVEKIVGPGNVYVTAAKLLVQKDVAIDMPAGPSEILIIADETANPKYVAFDCLAQLEHDPNALAIVLTTSKDLAENVERIANAEGGSLNLENLKIVIVESIDEALELSNKIAPEHLSIVCENAEKLLEKVKNAGSVFIGEFSPVACGDYASGTNHILPTSGYARIYSGLSVETFMKHMTYQILTKSALNRIGEAVIRLAKAEGLEFHAKSVEIRLKEE
ncbi:histidinol dehydrogenase [Archaeoglobus profundus]|uniref:Histidinol dehydrogenase n=1 Tax=Archaeoglobus profundus (strain DSM 5631 / JCM 9629 / NBRC 100127 / Av18) TaxID=572546 RepID=D2RD64_ARCPA|nr:histidinol dehydrogenase [Archaeoglobus profundus]ADB58058.1 histidinol dehydrogenase [Archaeoglobus profundus DSM 5631]